MTERCTTLHHEFESTTKVLPECMLKYYRSSECPVHSGRWVGMQGQSIDHVCFQEVCMSGQASVSMHNSQSGEFTATTWLQHLQHLSLKGLNATSTALQDSADLSGLIKQL